MAQSPQWMGSPSASRSANTFHAPSAPRASAVRWLITTSHTGVTPRSRKAAHSAWRSAFVPYRLASSWNSRPGRYPSGLALWLGGGSQRCVMPNPAMARARSVSHFQYDNLSSPLNRLALVQSKPCASTTFANAASAAAPQTRRTENGTRSSMAAFGPSCRAAVVSGSYCSRT